MKSQLTKAQKAQLDEFVSKIDWSNPNCPHKKALATTIVENVEEDLYTQEIISLLGDTRRFGPGEEMQFRTRSGLTAYIIEPGAFAPRSQITNTVVTLPRKKITVATELELGQLRSGRYGTIADLKKNAGEKILGAENQMAWDVTWRSVTAGNPTGNYASVSSGATAATKKAALDSAISYLEDYTNKGAKAIIGRFSALSFLEDAYLDTDYLPEEMKRELYMKSGFLGMYRGVPVFRLNAYKDAYGVQKIDANNVLVLGENVLKFGIEEPGLEVFEQVRGTTTHTWEMAFWYTVGAAVVEPEKIYRINFV